MACNCKKNVNTKYVDNKNFGYTELKRISGLTKMGNAVGQFFFGLLVALIMITALIPACCYIIFCLCTGKEMSARIPDFSKWLKKK